MSEIKINEREIVVPGEIIATGLDYLPAGFVFREGDNLISSRLGLVSINGRFIKVVPLTGDYIPKRGDLIIGKVVDIGINGWRIDMGWSCEANLSLKDATSEFIEKGSDLTKYFDYGDYIMAEIYNVIGSKLIDLTMKGPGLRKLGPGRVIHVNSAKVPRIIGKQGSMISMIKDATGCRISVGQNGTVWISGTEPEKELTAIKAIEKIEAESHIQGLTDRVKEFLEKNK